MNAKEHQELNCWVAEHVMGWKLGERRTILGYMAHGTVEIREWIGSETDFHCHTEESFKPTTDPAAAVEVLKKCNELIEGGIRMKKRKQGDWVVGKYEDLDPVWATGETIELAICKLAKKIFLK